MVATLLVMVYNLTILVGTVYLIAEKDWNPWWMLLAVLLLANRKVEK